MTDRQDQKLGQNAIGIQSGRDTTIYQCLNPAQLREIVEILADQMPKMAAVASAIVEVRLKSFEENVIKRFVDDRCAKSEAFADPDFQYVVGSAQRAYARTGDTGTHSTLIDLIAKRSIEDTGSRRAFVINDAIEITSKLGKAEINELALVFAVRYCRADFLKDFEKAGNYFNEIFRNLIDDVETKHQSYDYIVSQRCGTISSGTIPLMSVTKHTYPGLFMRGFAPTELDGMILEYTDKLDDVLDVSQVEEFNRKPGAIFHQEFIERYSSVPSVWKRLDDLWKKGLNTIVDDDTASSIMKLHCNTWFMAEEKWNNSLLKSLDLTAIGQAIGHARLTQIAAFGNPNLSKWIT